MEETTSIEALPDCIVRAAQIVGRRAKASTGQASPIFIGFMTSDPVGQDELVLSISNAAVSLIVGSHGRRLDGLCEDLLSLGLIPEFTGVTADGGQELPLAVLRGTSPPIIEKAPDSFRPLAIVVAYNEEDVIASTLRHLVDHELDVYFVDNWSSDATLDLAKEVAGSRLVGWERFPSGGPSNTYDWALILNRVERIAIEHSPAWIVCNDADEVRIPPWPEVTLRDALFHVHNAGLNAVNYTTIDFCLTAGTEAPPQSLQEYFRWFRPVRMYDLGQLNTWYQSSDCTVDIASSGRHTVQFANRRPFPYNFLLKHYPIRSVEQGLRKINRDRLPRYRVDERLRDWHYHYSRATPQSLIQVPATLDEFTPDFNQRFLLQRLTGVGFEPAPPASGPKVRLTRLLRRFGLLDGIRRLKWKLHIG